MRTIELRSRSKYSWALLKSRKYRVELVPACDKGGHLQVFIKGPGFRKQGRSSIPADLSEFELKAVALHFYKQAREYGKNIPSIRHTNYAELFGSVFE